MRVLVTRPRGDAERTARLLAARGHVPILAPLLETRFFDGPPPDLTGVQAILATSANGVRAFARRSPARDLPLFAVGPQTAAAAGRAGFSDVRNADGDAHALAGAAARWATPQGGALLHVAGEGNDGVLAADLEARGFVVRRAILYAVEAAGALPAEAAAALAGARLDAALFFSPRSAAVFAALAAGLCLRGVIAACISPAAARALAPLSFAGVRVAARPNQDALLALLD